MDTGNFKKYLPYVWTALPCIGAIIIFIFGIVNSHAPVKIMMFICAALLLVLGGLIYLYYYLFGERRRNYFLTNRDTGRNIRLSELDFSVINERMNFFMAKRITDEHELWVGGFLGKRGLFGTGDVFKPLAIYKMLFDLGEVNTFDNWRMFFDMPDADFARMINCLESVGDLNMSRKLTALRRVNDGTQTERLSEFITGNSRYIQNKMIAYVTSHIREFDDPKK